MRYCSLEIREKVPPRGFCLTAIVGANRRSILAPSSDWYPSFALYYSMSIHHCSSDRSWSMINKLDWIDLLNLSDFDMGEFTLARRDFKRATSPFKWRMSFTLASSFTTFQRKPKWIKVINLNLVDYRLIYHVVSPLSEAQRVQRLFEGSYWWTHRCSLLLIRPFLF